MRFALRFGALPALLASVLLGGCASYRTSSNISAAPASPQAELKAVLIYESGRRPKRKFKEIQKVEVSVKKLTIFHEDPTREQANEVLLERARVLGADAVIDVEYRKGVGFTTWGYMDATGMAIVFSD